MREHQVDGILLAPAEGAAWDVVGELKRHAWIPERSATRLREADLDIFSKLGKQGLE